MHPHTHHLQNNILIAGPDYHRSIFLMSMCMCVQVHMCLRSMWGGQRGHSTPFKQESGWPKAEWTIRLAGQASESQAYSCLLGLPSNGITWMGYWYWARLCIFLGLKLRLSYFIETCIVSSERVITPANGAYIDLEGTIKLLDLRHIHTYPKA